MGRRLWMGGVRLLGWRCAEEKGTAGVKVGIVCTTGMIGDFVRVIAGDAAEVVVLMGPGVDPHSFSASKTDVELLSRADIIFYNGLSLEARMQDLFARWVRSKKVVAISRDIPAGRLRPLSGFEGGYDPHIWFDVSLWKEAVGPVVATLSELRPDLYAEFKVRGEAYRARIDTLHHWVRALMDSVSKERRFLITAHDAFGYYGDAYGIKVVGLQGVAVSDDGITDANRLSDLIVDSSVEAIFVESSLPEQPIRKLMKECLNRGADVSIGGTLYSGALGVPGSEADTYVGMISFNTRLIAAALR